MRKFVAKPPVFEAEQWDGTLESAKRIASAVKKSEGRVHAHIVTSIGDDGQRPRIEFLKDGFINNDRRMFVTDWAVFTPHSLTVVMSDAEFREKYQPLDGADGA